MLVYGPLTRVKVEYPLFQVRLLLSRPSWQHVQSRNWKETLKLRFSKLLLRHVLQITCYLIIIETGDPEGVLCLVITLT